MRRGPFAPILAFAFSCAGAAEASPEDLFSYGTRSPAMGGTGAASADGFEAAYLNPALLSRLRERKLTLGLQTATFSLDASGEGLPGRLSSKRAKGVVIGVDLPVPFGGALKDRVGIGLAFYTPTDVIVRGRLLYPETPQYPLLPDRAQSLMIRVGAGADLGYGLRVGAGFAALAEIAGTVLVATDATGRVGTRVEDQLIATYAPTFGITYDLPLKITQRVRVGLVYRGTLDARFSVGIDATTLSTLKLPLFNIAGLAQYDPAQIALEIATETEHFTIAAGATYKRWSKYPGPLEPTILCPAESPDCSALRPPRIAYDDTVVVRLGVDYAILAARGLTAHVRGGGFLEPNPLPSQVPTSQAYDASSRQTVELPTRYFNATRVALTWGAGLELARPLPPVNLDLYGQYHVLLPNDVASRAPDGTSAPVGRASGHVVVGGLLAGVRF